MPVDYFDPGCSHAMAKVVYYLSRNGKVEPPHMIDVAYHDPGLRLRDVKFRLTSLRGSRMPVMYAWSFKRIYKNTSIWQDVSDDDFVLPVASGEYVLKGSEIVEKQLPKCKQHGEVLLRKYRGAESWLTAVDPSSKSSKPDLESFQPLAQRRSYEQPAPRPKTVVLHSGLPEDKHSSDGEVAVDAGVRHSTGNILQDSPYTDLKVYTIKTPAVTDQACDATTQTEELRRKMGQTSTSPALESRLPGQEIKAQRQEKLPPDEVVLGVDSSASPQAKKHGKFKKAFAPEKEPGDLRLKSKNGSSSWVFLHVLSYCGGLNTKDQAVNPPLVSTKDISSEYSPDEHSRDLRGDGDNHFFSDTSRETQHSTTGDSFNSSDASDGGRAHKLPALVDVKEMLKPSSPVRGRGFSFLGRQYGRLSKSGTYCSRNVKYDFNRGNGALKLELNCYNAE